MQNTNFERKKIYQSIVRRRNVFHQFLQSCILGLLLIHISSCGIFKHTKKTTKSNETNAKVNTILKTAFNYKGTVYKLGGTDRKGIDCSGLVKISFESVNVLLPRRSIEQSKVGEEIPLQKAHKGDLIFFNFDTKGKQEIDHVGIISDVENSSAIKFVHASTKVGVTEDDLSKPYNKKAYIKCMRVLKSK